MWSTKRPKPLPLKARRPLGRARKWTWGANILRAHRLNDQLDRAWRRAVFARDRYTCVDCGKQHPLNADHILPRSAYPELRHDVQNGRTLCAPCHKQTPTYGSGAKYFRRS